jgi:hypothetical protein
MVGGISNDEVLDRLRGFLRDPLGPPI